MEPSCGLPDEYLDIFKKKFSIEQQVFVSPTSGRAASNTTKKSKFPLGKERKRSYPQPLNTAPFPVSENLLDGVAKGHTKPLMEYFSKEINKLQF